MAHVEPIKTNGFCEISKDSYAFFVTFFNFRNLNN